MSEERVQSIRDFLDRFDKAADHFKESQRQALLGIRESMRVLEDLAMAYHEEAPLLRHLATGLLLSRGAVDLLISRMPELIERGDTVEIRIEALGILRDLLAAELMRIERDGDPTRREGILTVIGIIDQEIERIVVSAQEQSAEPEESTSVEWFEVES